MAPKVTNNPPIIKAHPIFRTDLQEIGKPQTRWTELAHTEDQEALKTYFVYFTRLALLGTALLFVGCLTLYRARKITILSGTLLALTAIVFVASAFFGVRSLGEDKSHLLPDREDVKNSIETLPLGRIRSSYPQKEVVSDAELNQWAQYFLYTQKLTQFMDAQGGLILDLELEPETKVLLMQKCIYSVYFPDDPKNLQLSSELSDSGLIPETEKEQISQLREQLRSFLSANSLAGLKHEQFKEKGEFRSEALKKRNAWLFANFIWKQGIGVKKLNEDYKKELEFFFPDTDLTRDSRDRLFSYIVDRDAQQLDYIKFIENNGIESIQYLTNFHVFAKLVLQSDLGLLSSRTTFPMAFERFKPLIPTLEEAIVEQEWSDLSSRTYLQIRARIGDKDIDRIIRQITDPEVKEQLKKKFMQMPPAKIANRDTYKEGIASLGVTDEEIWLELANSWGDMSLKEIVGLSKENRAQFIKNIDLDRLKKRAIGEFAGMPVSQITEEYFCLVEEGILSPSDFDYSERLLALTNNDLWTLIGQHGEKLFSSKVLQQGNPRVKIVIFNYICTNAEQFLGDNPLPEEGMWKIIQKNFYPWPFQKLRKDTIANRATARINYGNDIKALEDQCEQDKRGIESAAEEQASKADLDHRTYRRLLDQAKSDLSSKETAQKTCQSELEELDRAVTAALSSYQENESRAERLAEKKERLGQISSLWKYLERDYQEKLDAIADAKKRTEKHYLEGNTIAITERQIERDEASLVSLNEQLAVLKGELEKKIASSVSETLVTEETSVPQQNIDAAADSEEKETSGIPVISHIASGFRSLRKGFTDSKKETETPFEKEVRRLREKIALKSEEVTNLQRKIAQKREAIKESLETIATSSWILSIKKEADALAANNQPLLEEEVKLKAEIYELKSQLKDQNQMHTAKLNLERKLKHKRIEMERIQTELQSIIERKNTAQANYDKANTKLEELRRSSASQITEAKKVCDEELEKNKKIKEREFKAALVRIQEDAQRELQLMQPSL